MIKKLFIILFLFTQLHGVNYEKLQAKKDSYKNRLINQPKKSTTKANTEKYIEIRYKDINNMQTNLLEKKYNLILWLVIADGISIYQYEGKERLDTLVKELKKDMLNIQSVKIYEKYHFINY